MARRLLLLLLTVLSTTLWACRGPEPASSLHSGQPVEARVKALADAYVSAYFDRHPEEATLFGVPGRHHDRLTDNSLAALTAWQAKEDGWLADAKTIDPSRIADTRLRATYAIVREALEGSIASRVCRDELWDVSQQNGWHVSYSYLVTIQPVGSVETRQQALARWGALPRYIENDIANLREGLKRRYSAPKTIVQIVIDQLNTLIAGSDSDSPFLSPATRDTAPEFRQAFTSLVLGPLASAFARYRDFLEKEYLPAARDALAVSANPDGLTCYSAAIRAHSSLPVLPAQVHELGLKQLEELTAEMKAIAERSFQTSDVQGLLQRLRTDRTYLFKDRQQLIAYSQAALARAKLATPRAFAALPMADVRIEPYPRFREKNAPNEYNPPAEDGSRPALFYISAYEAEKQSRAIAESTAFHETIPGHHLQIAYAVERKDIHPVGRYIQSGGYTEGWALYAERLADELKMYSSDLDRLGMLSSQAFRAARLVVDSGLHTMGWSRQRALDYLLAHTSESPGYLASEVDRYVIWPGQATSYFLGMMQIRNVRDAAEQTLGPRFDLKGFHERVLEDGAVPLGFLTEKIHAWAGGVKEHRADAGR